MFKIIVTIFLFFLSGVPAVSYAENIKLELSECGQEIAGFKKFLREARHCNTDNDCTVIEGMCPLGCKFYIHKIFQTTVSKRMVQVQNICGESVCSYKCPKMTLKPVCTNNKCENYKAE